MCWSTLRLLQKEGIGLPFTFTAADIAIYRMSGSEIILFLCQEVGKERGGLSCLLFVFASPPPSETRKQKDFDQSLHVDADAGISDADADKDLSLRARKVSPKECQRISTDKKPGS